MDAITNAVSQYAKLKGVSIQAIAANTGISYNVLQPSFAGRRKLRADEFLEICNFLSVNPKEFGQTGKSSIGTDN